MTTTQSSRSEIRSVLVATDLSKTAAAGLRWATEIAIDHDARLHLVHALSDGGWPTDFVELDPGVRAQTEETLRERLACLAEEPRRRGLEITFEIETGTPSEVIVSTAHDHDVDLLVVGTRGLRGLDYLLLGSTAQRVIQRAPCPVLTVHPQDADRQGPVRRILAATDFSTESSNAILASISLLGGTPDGAEICLLHVYHVPYELGLETGYVSTTSGLRQWQTAQADVESRLERLATRLCGQGLTVKVLAIEGYPPEVIIEQACRLGPDLIAMGTHGRTGLSHVLLGSTAERVIHRAPCPVLTIRKSDPREGGPVASPLSNDLFTGNA